MPSGHNPLAFKVGGALPPTSPSYITRQADTDLYTCLSQGEYCYVLNTRQVGKTSLRVKVTQRLMASNVACASIDLSMLLSRNTTPQQLIGGIMQWLSMELKLNFNVQSWLLDHNYLSPTHQLGEFIDRILLNKIEEQIVVFVDEIDSILRLSFSADSLFALIRSCYNKRAEDPRYQRLAFCLIGVATPSGLVTDKQVTPFNIGRSIDLRGFTLDEAKPLEALLACCSMNPSQLLEAIILWTNGQPFLTQKLCYLLTKANTTIPTGSEYDAVSQLVEEHIIVDWESKDRPIHL